MDLLFCFTSTGVAYYAHNILDVCLALYQLTHQRYWEKVLQHLFTTCDINVHKTATLFELLHQLLSFENRILKRPLMSRISSCRLSWTKTFIRDEGLTIKN